VVSRREKSLSELPTRPVSAQSKMRLQIKGTICTCNKMGSQKGSQKKGKKKLGGSSDNITTENNNPFGKRKFGCLVIISFSSFLFLVTVKRKGLCTKQNV